MMKIKGWLCWGILATFAVWSDPSKALADEAQLQEIRAAWSICQNVIAQRPDSWIGWRRDFFNGYADNFSFWSNAGSRPGVPSVLRTTRDIDAVAYVETTYCFRSDESLAFVLTIMTSTNVVEGPNHSKPVTQEGRIYLGRDGAVLKVLGQIIDTEKKRHPVDNEGWQPMRSCLPIPVYGTVAAVEKAYVAELGDIEGNRPAFEPEQLDWCARTLKP